MVPNLEILLPTVLLGLVILLLNAYICRFGLWTGTYWGIALGIAAGLIVPLEMGVLGLSGRLWSLSLGFITILGLWAGVVMLRFYRNPERTPPEGEGLILSPADGRVIYIKKVREGKVPLSVKRGQEFELTELTQTDLIDRPSYLIGIEMSILNVHVNRASIDGKVLMQKSTKGGFISLKRPEAVFRNSRMTTVIDNGKMRVAIIQIASRLVRLITSYVRQGDELSLGQRLGMIKFGSQVDMVLPEMEDLKILVKVGTKVKAGISVLTTYK